MNKGAIGMQDQYRAHFKVSCPAGMGRTFGEKVASMNDARCILAQCKKLLGRNYKVAIRHGWQTGNYGALVDVACELQQIRNQYGPAWLEREVV